MAASVPGQVEVIPKGNNSGDEECSYYDVLVLGRTGMGKSTLANKLLGIDPDTKQLYEALPAGKGTESVIKKWDIEGDPNLYFDMGDGAESVTKTCKVLSNENTMTRVLDTPGFTSMDIASTYGIARGNWECLRLVVQKQRGCDLRFSRVVYFMPSRGPPERVDGTLQEEIEALHGYFGQKIFDILVVAVTNINRDHYQEAGFLNEDFRRTQEVFLAAYEGKTGTSLPKCPPIIYVSFLEDHQNVLNRITSAEVISDAEMLDYSPEFPIDREEKMPTSEPPNATTWNECKKCAAMILTDVDPKSGAVSRRVQLEDEAPISYDNSSCHPDFVPKYSTYKKFVGGIGHIFTLGFFMCFKFSWPGFTNSEQVCIECSRLPRTEGCCPVNQSLELNGTNYKVDHETQ